MNCINFTIHICLFYRFVSVRPRDILQSTYSKILCHHKETKCQDFDFQRLQTVRYAQDLVFYRRPHDSDQLCESRQLFLVQNRGQPPLKQVDLVSNHLISTEDIILSSCLTRVIGRHKDVRKN
ncbi:hypothetical protein RRG08_061862 [Elysia crispata]|uniref:Uncharacterized protein n=1 Tax=Elysia crispata TaxID=231223 RepID=A0AAE0XM07_9GAST|nr:hypothetical protein RRG08_061862 [Elysia crispata]